MSLEEIAYLAGEQAGLFTTAQAAGLGVDRAQLHRGVHRGVLRSPRRGVYAFESTPLTPQEDLRAAWLSLDPSRTVARRLQDPATIVVSTTSAAACYGIGDFETVQHEFYTARRKQTRADDIRLRLRSLDVVDVDIRQGLPLTTPTRIVLDLLRERVDLGHISRMIADAIKQGLPIEWSRIADQATAHAEEYGLSAAGLLAALAQASESPSDAARTTLSMIESYPELSRDLHTQLAASLGTITRMLLSPQAAADTGPLRGVFDPSPDLPQLPGQQAQPTR